MSATCNSHGCATPAARQSPRYRRVLWAALLLNAAMFGVEIAGGPDAGSVSLLADAADLRSHGVGHALHEAPCPERLRA